MIKQTSIYSQWQISTHLRKTSRVIWSPIINTLSSCAKRNKSFSRNSLLVKWWVLLRMKKISSIPLNSLEIIKKLILRKLWLNLLKKQERAQRSWDIYKMKLYREAWWIRKVTFGTRVNWTKAAVCPKCKVKIKNLKTLIFKKGRPIDGGTRQHFLKGRSLKWGCKELPLRILLKLRVICRPLWTAETISTCNVSSQILNLTTWSRKML